MATNTAEQTTGLTRLSLDLSAGWITLLCFLGGTIFILLWLRPTPRSKRAASTADDGPDPSPPTYRGVHLVEVTRDRNEANTDIDIIAIHGLDTTSRDTWTWKDPRDPKNDRTWVNWLHPGMLPESVEGVRIFTCDWPADLLVPSDSVQKTIEEYALLLLEGIRSALFAGSAGQQDRCIVFIASCLGGLVLMRALVRADDEGNGYYRIRVATRGIVFLATPFRGTSFQDVTAWAEAGLKAKAALQGRAVSRLLDSVKGSTFELEEGIRRLTQLCQHKDKSCEVFAFYELGTTSLPQKAFPWLPGWFHQRKQLVDRSSATLDIIPDPLPLDRPHSLMNKFRDPRCPDYEKVAGKVRGIVEKIRAGTPLEQADRLIRDKHYTADRLKIERLSGEPLSMDQCYINLAIIEQSGRDASHSKKEGRAAPSPFSILIRQKVERPDTTMQVELATIFNKREGKDSQLMYPRRILIRGRAGAGKSTLCKKIIYEFTKGTYRKWNELFDRVLWVPLRNLKLPERRSMAKYTFEDLFSHEFLLPTDGQNPAGALSRVLAAERNNTLFLLDGLDEVSEDLTGDGGMARFFTELLSQPNVIVTSRPSTKPPANLHLELETIGFGPDQVNEYIKKSFINPRTAKADQTKIDKVQSFLQEHWLMQGLVRIPIQLDALCYTWDDLKSNAILNTMTGMCETIEMKLWKKDILRLEKKHDGKELTKEYLTTAGRQKVEGFVKDEMAFIESLAFTGLLNDIIDFSSEHLDGISDHFTPNLLPDKTLPSISFLRPSDVSLEYHSRHYHFIHLTFQEYFAARYFVRQWKDPEGQLLFLTLSSIDTVAKADCPVEFLRKHKYTARYDIFWRFVAGLLDVSRQAPEFINTIEQEPLDILGPTHQRLVMHCLSEITRELPTRGALEKRLAQWLLFEWKFINSTKLASEVEFPELALMSALSNESLHFWKAILQSLESRASIPRSIIEAVAPRLDHEDRDVRVAAVRALGGRAALPVEVLMTVVARLNDEDGMVRQATVEALGGHAALPDKVLTAVAARLGDEYWYVRSTAVHVLGRGVAVTNEVLTAIAARLDDEDWRVRSAAIYSLSRRAELPDNVLAGIAARLSDGSADVQSAANYSLSRRAVLPDNVLASIAARLGDEDWSARLDDEDGDVQRAAVEALGSRVALPDRVLTAVAARLDDEDSCVRWAAVGALAARLHDEDDEVRQAAVKTLGRRVALPDELLTDVAARLGDDNWEVRQATVEALSEREALPDEVLTAVVARLGDEVGSVRKGAVDIFMHRHKTFSRARLKGSIIPTIYKALLERSFSEQLSWYIDQGKSCVKMPDGDTELFIDIQQNEVGEWLNGARPADYPSTSSGESLANE
ncbi:hypothetical protein V2A60_008429 [Cordyceps javanica]